jgi:hypothetical protein
MAEKTSIDEELQEFRKSSAKLEKLKRIRDVQKLDHSDMQ